MLGPRIVKDSGDVSEIFRLELSSNFMKTYTLDSSDNVLKELDFCVGVDTDGFRSRLAYTFLYMNQLEAMSIVLGSKKIVRGRFL